VPRGVDNIEAVVSPVASSCCRLNSNAALLLLFHKVRSCGSIVHFTGFMNFTSKLENSFCSGGLARINVGEDTNISVM